MGVGGCADLGLGAASGVAARDGVGVAGRRGSGAGRPGRGVRWGEAAGERREGEAGGPPAWSLVGRQWSLSALQGRARQAAK
jgi:hypothetical protein